MTTPGTPPAGDAEWARDTEKRLRQLESPNTMRVGPWVISSRDGELVATKPGDEIVFGTLPPETEVSDVTRGYVTNIVNNVTNVIEESIGNPNGGGGLPVIKDFLNGKWDDLVAVTETADARSVAGNNLVTNPGFEKALFHMGDGVAATDIKRTGTRSGALTANGTSQKKLYLTASATGPATITATAGDIFYAEAWVWGKSTNTQVSGGANGMGIYLDVFDKDGAKLGQSLTLTGPTASNALNNQWSRFYGYVAIPTTSPYNATAAFTAYIGLNSNAAAGSVYYFDDPIVRVDSLVNAWNYIYDAANGTSGSLGRGPSDVFTPIKNVRDGLFGGGSFGASGGALNTAGLAVAGASGARALTQSLIDSVVVGLKNTIGQDFLPSAAEQAAGDVNTNITNLQIRTGNLEAQKDAGMFYGTVVDEVFGTYAAASTLGSKWAQVSTGTGSATWAIAAGLRGGLAAQVVPVTGNLTRTCKARLVEQTETRYQKVGVVFGGVGRGVDAVYIYGRMSADLSRYVYVKFSGNHVIIGYNNGSGEIPIASSDRAYTLKSGVTYWLDCGLGDTAQWTYQLWENNASVTTAVDSSTTSPNSPTDSLGAGFGAVVTNATDASPLVSGFALYDNVPPARRGMGFRASCINSEANFNLSPSPSNNNTGFFPENWFLSEFAPPADMLYDPSTNTLTVSQPGYYLVEVVQKGSYNLEGIGLTSGRAAGAVFKDTGSGNFAIERIGPATFQTSLKPSFGFACVVYLKGGNRIRPGYWSSWSTSGTSFVGSGAGETYWAVTFLHNSYTKITSV